MLVLLASVACSSGKSHNEASPERDILSRSVDVGGYSLWIDCEGTGSPTVLLEAGGGRNFGDWAEVQLDLSAHNRVCAYDRAGLGASDPRPNNGEPVTAGTMAKELRTLLRAAGVSPPYVVVGHSFGGMVARVFANMYRPDVEGVVLVDSSSEEQLHGRFARLVRSMGFSWTEAEQRLDMRETERQLERGDLGSLPLVVLTAGDPLTEDFPDWVERVLADFQRNLAGLSSDSVHVLALDSQHFIQWDQPDLVIEAIKQVVKAAESDEALPPCGSAFSELGGRSLSR
jgi:alpha/beta hydrolase fold